MSHVGTYYQQPAESNAEFLYRVAGALRAYTAASGFEGCGNICRDPSGRHAIVLFTDASQFRCQVRNGCPFGGYGLTRDFIHSHPVLESAAYSVADAWVAKRFRHRGVAAGKVVRPIGWRFSRGDYELGPGYLVYGDTLLYQEGRGTARRVGRIPEHGPDGCHSGASVPVRGREAR